MKVNRPQTLEEAINFLADNPEAKIVAGGTDLLPRLNQKLEFHPILCYIDDMPMMMGVNREADGALFVGASVRLAQIPKIPELAPYSAVWQAASKVASPQIRNQATIGGNILQENRCMFFNNQVPWSDVNHCFKWGGKQCFQIKKSPDCVALFQSDVAPALVAYNAVAVIHGLSGTREMPVADLYGDWGRNNKNIAHDEILLGIKLPPVKEGERSAYVRKTIRGSFDFPLLSCASRMVEKAGIIEEIAVVFGAAGVKPVRFPAAYGLLAKELKQASSMAAQMKPEVTKVISPFADTRVNAGVRNAMGLEMFIKSISRCAGDND